MTNKHVQTKSGGNVVINNINAELTEHDQGNNVGRSRDEMVQKVVAMRQTANKLK